MALFDTLVTHGSVGIVHVYVLCTVAIFAAFLGQNEILKKIAKVLTGIAVAAHAGVITSFLFAYGEFSRDAYMHLLAWGVMTAGWYAWVMRTFPLLALFSTPLALLLTLLGFLAVKSDQIIPQDFSAMFTVLHIGTLFSSFVLMTVGFCAGVLFLALERRIKSKSRLIKNVQHKMPSLSTLDKINSWVTVIGFPLFALGILAGLVGARIAWGGLIFGDPKELVSLIICLLFAWLFHQRLAGGWRGHKPAVVMVSLFALCIFSLTVVNLFMTTHHSF